ncbi:MAG: glycosyltransferase family 39 protein [Chloroflexi bacterium]|nr:glycosyltransferase family 39 protein [Chloroflexota bacterium]
MTVTPTVPSGLSAASDLLAVRTRLPSRLFWLSLVLGAFMLRLHWLYAAGFWFDEAASYYIAGKGLAGILDYARLSPGEHPPVYYWPFLLWMNAAGTTEFALRYFSLFFGVLFVPLFYRFARRHFDHRLALLATLLAVPMPFLVTYSQEARMYTLVMCLSVLAADYFLRWVRGDSRAAWLHFLFIALALSVHYYALLLLAAEDVYLLSRRDLWRRVGLPLALAHLVLGGALAAWLFSARGAVASVGLAFRNPLFAGRSFDETARIAVDLMVGGVVIRPLDLPDYLLSALGWLLVLLGILWAHRHLDAWSRGAPLRAWLFAVAIVPVLLATVVPYVYAARYLFVTIPAWLLLLASGLLSLRTHPRRAAAAGLLLAVIGLYGLNQNYGFIKSPYREMSNVVNTNGRPGDTIILHGPGQWPLALYYLKGGLPQRYIPTNAEAAELVDIDPGMRALQNSSARLWVVSEQAIVVDPGNNVPRWLALNAYPVLRFWFKNGQAVALYASGSTLQPPRLWQSSFGEWLLLEQAALSANTAAPGDSLAIELKWHALKPIPQPLQLLMTLRLVDAADRVVVERVTKPCDGFCPIDDWVPGDSMPDRHGLLVPPDAPPGEYRLQLSVFSPRQNADLPVAGTPGSVLELARIRVGPAASGR